MKKILFVAFVSTVILVGCKKTCDCTTKRTYQYEIYGQDYIPYGESNVTYDYSTVTIKKGKCSDMNYRQTSSINGETVTEVVDCVPK
jgi:major membrane immunogen (membrane-anchored lipoprotein)